MKIGRVVALVQARMGSKRFPGKMFEMLGDHPLIEWVLLRTSKAELIDQVVLTTSIKSSDDPLEDFANNMGLNVYRGSETDVLGRMAEAAENYSAETVIRICADNPFIDPHELDRLIKEYRSKPCDYACNHQNRLNSRYADGFGAEILSNNLLQKIAKISLRASHREHVTLYIWDNAKLFQLHCIEAPSELAFPELKFDVNTPLDLNQLNILVSNGVGLGSEAKQIIKCQNSNF